MATYGLGLRTTATTAANASFEAIASSGNKPTIQAMELTNVTAVASEFGIGRPAATGVTPTSPQTVVDEGDGNGATGQTTAATAWGTGPTVPANFNRRYEVIAAIGAGFAVVFPNGFKLPVSKSAVVWLLATAPATDVNIAVNE